jgi:hypothetical protein
MRTVSLRSTARMASYWNHGTGIPMDFRLDKNETGDVAIK